MTRVTSPQDPAYNCISWAIRDKENFWWPAKDYTWTEEIPLYPTIDTFIQFFRSHRYECCNDVNLEDGFEKIAIFAKADNDPSHAARQLRNGLWTSKLGPLADIEHNLVEDLTNDPFLASYGSVKVVMRRRIEQGE